MRMAEEKRVTITSDIEEARAMCDAELICIVLRNLVSNGIKYAEAGGNVCVCITAPAGGVVKITVRDDGVGMSQAAKADLFALKCATSEAGTLGEKGTGLDLYLCHDIVSRHGGEISVDSEPGAGTAIHFTLPASPH